MEEKELLQQLTIKVKELNATISEARANGLIVNVEDTQETGRICSGPLVVTVCKQVLSTS